VAAESLLLDNETKIATITCESRLDAANSQH